MFERGVKEFFDKRDVRINGDRPWDIRVNDERFYGRLLAGGTLAMGERYMDGWWDCDQIDVMTAKVLRVDPWNELGTPWLVAAQALFLSLGNPQNPFASFMSGQHHYDIGNDLYRTMLDKRMTYTCGYWKDATNLNAAQEAKLDLTCRKIGLREGQCVLDIGCGWGSFMKFAVEKYGVECVGLTVSKEQAALASNMCAGLPIEIRLQDYRDLGRNGEKFDHIVSLGMFEHVGHKNYRTFMQVVRKSLKDDGLFLLHTIGNLVSVTGFDPWMAKYIFPNAQLPSVAQLGRATEKLLVMEDWHNFGPDYDKTLMAWHANLEARWSELPQYDQRFRRMWRYYLLSCAGTFRARMNQLWQIVYSPSGTPDSYQAVR